MHHRRRWNCHRIDKVAPPPSEERLELLFGLVVVVRFLRRSGVGTTVFNACSDCGSGGRRRGFERRWGLDQGFSVRSQVERQATLERIQFEFGQSSSGVLSDKVDPDCHPSGRRTR